MKTDTINTLEFWEKVKEEYEDALSESYFLCWESGTFRDQWDYSDNNELETLGEVFLKESPESVFKIIRNSASLFQIQNEGTYGSVLDIDKKQIRRLFIDWNIKRLKK